MLKCIATHRCLPIPKVTLLTQNIVVNICMLSQKNCPAKCKKYNTGHFLATGPSFSSLASSGSTILNRHHNFEDEDDGREVNVHSKSDDEYVMPLKDGEGGGGGGDYGGDGGSGPNPSSGIGNMRRVPRTNSYYHRAGMTPRLDDMHFLANAPSFSSVATTATNITDARLTSMASLANTSFASRNGLTAAAMSMASTSNLHNDPRFALLNSQGAAGISRTISTATSTSSAAGSTRSNSSLPGGIVRPLGTGNIFLQQDDPEYQNLLTSIATSTVVVGRQPNTGDRCGRHPTTSAADTSRLQQQQQQQQQQVASSSSCGMLSLHRRRSSSALGSSQPSSTRRVASSSSLRRSSSTSAGSILRRGRYSSGFLGSIREHEGDDHHADGGEGANRRNASFTSSNGRRNSTSSNNVQFTAPTIHQLVRDFQPNEMHGDIPANIVIDATAPDGPGAMSKSSSPSVSGTSTPSSAPNSPPTKTKIECLDGGLISKSNASSVCSAGRALRRARSLGSFSSISSLGSRHSNRV